MINLNSRKNSGVYANLGIIWLNLNLRKHQECMPIWALFYIQYSIFGLWAGTYYSKFVFISYLFPKEKYYSSISSSLIHCSPPSCRGQLWQKCPQNTLSIHNSSICTTYIFPHLVHDILLYSRNQWTVLFCVDSNLQMATRLKLACMVDSDDWSMDSLGISSASWSHQAIPLPSQFLLNSFNFFPTVWWKQQPTLFPACPCVPKFETSLDWI